jgi:hypothetical protein
MISAARSPSCCRASSPGHQKNPRGPNHQEHGREEEGRY